MFCIFNPIFFILEIYFMIINYQTNYATHLLTFQKKKLYYNRQSHNYFIQPLSIFVEIVHLLELQMSNFFSGVRVRYSLLLIFITIVVYAGTSIIPSDLTSMTPRYQSVSCQEENQLKNLPKKEIDRTSFIQFKTKNNKKYNNPQEEVFRSLVFNKNRDFINAHNSNINRTYNMALNSNADLIPSEFSQIYSASYKSNEIIKNLSQKIVSQSLTGLLQYQDASSIKSYIQNSINQRIDTYTNYDTFDMQVLKKTSPIKNYQTLNQRKNNIINSINLKTSNCTSGNSNTLTIASFINLNPLGSTNYNKTNSTSLLKATLTNDTILSSTISTSSTNQNGNYIGYSIDWTVHAGKVRYQGICGACYTFATSDALGSLYSIYKYGFFVTLSTQQVIDCSTNGLTYGCNGGFLQGSYAYMQVKGIQTDYNYPYTSASSGIAGSCKKDGGNFKISSFKNIPEGDCKAVLNQLNYGPVSIGIAGYRLQFYSQGIFNDCNNYIDHAVVLISYKGGVGWKIKNSWGSDWGMNGFAWIADGNNCGICNMAVAAKL